MAGSVSVRAGKPRADAYTECNGTLILFAIVQSSRNRVHIATRPNPAPKSRPHISWSAPPITYPACASRINSSMPAERIRSTAAIVASSSWPFTGV